MPVDVGPPLGSENAQPRQLHIGGQYLITRQGAPSRKATILELRNGKTGREAYISYEHSDKRLDTWVKEADIGVEMSLGVIGKTNTQETGNQDGQLAAPGAKAPEPSPSAPSTPEREHAQMTRVRNFEDVRFGLYLVKTWYYSPYPMPIDEKPDPQPSTSTSTPSAKRRKLEDGASNGHALTTKPESEKGSSSRASRTFQEVFVGVGKGGEGARGRLWVCDLCFKYMRTRDGWTRHVANCDMHRPPGRKVYQRGSYTIWEVDGAQSPLYCQNLSLFGKLFIDHKSVFYHVENFLFYAICDASTSKHDHVMAFFSKEKTSYDDSNLACIVTFPPCQNRGFGKLLIEFSYYLTKHPSTRPANGSPGTPERPLSDLGLKGYTAYWVSTVLRVCRRLLEGAPRVTAPDHAVSSQKTPVKVEGRPKRDRKSAVINATIEDVEVNDVEMTKILDPTHPGQHAISLTLSDLAKACHLREDDTAFTLSELGFLKHRREPVKFNNRRRRRRRDEDEGVEGTAEGDGEEEGSETEHEEWKGFEIVISRDMVDAMWDKWKVKEQGVLDESCVLL